MIFLNKKKKVASSLSAIIYSYYNYLSSEGSLQIVTYILCKSNNCGIIILIMTTSGALSIIEIVIITMKVKLITLHIFTIAFDFNPVIHRNNWDRILYCCGRKWPMQE